MQKKKDVEKEVYFALRIVVFCEYACLCKYKLVSYAWICEHKACELIPTECLKQQRIVCLWCRCLAPMKETQCLIK